MSETRLLQALRTTIIVSRLRIVTKDEPIPERYEGLFVPERLESPMVVIGGGADWMTLAFPEGTGDDVSILPFYDTNSNHLYLLTFANATWKKGCEPTDDEMAKIIIYFSDKRWKPDKIAAATGISEVFIRSVIQ
ncbi:MAG: hypothetical protein V4469_02110 [Patescibacteria group bacterium]